MQQASIQRGDWVTCQGSSVVGVVTRVAADGRWADVDWHTHTKRMQTAFLQVHTTLSLGGGWSVTDLTRELERRNG